MIDLVYICSSARSGSTLLNLLIGAYPTALPVSEINRLPEHIQMNSKCTCGEPIAQCSFWMPIIDEISDKIGTDLWSNPRGIDLGFTKPSPNLARNVSTYFYLIRRTLYLLWLDLLQSVGVQISSSPLCRRYQRWILENSMLHDLIRRHSGRPLIVDSSKDVKVAVGLYRARPDRTRIILLSRDGRGVMASNLRTKSNLGNSVRAWVRYYKRALRWLAREVDERHVLRVRYEDLVANPTNEVSRIFGFLGVQIEKRVEGIKPDMFHVFSGNRNTLKTKSISADQRLKTELTDEHLAFFERHGAETMVALGYEYRRSSQ